MSVTWHIVRKDLRRIGAPALLWLALVVGGMVWIRTASPHFVGHIPSEIDTWVSLLRIWGRLLIIAELAMAYLLAASLLLEDPVVGSNAFWLTRPIAAGRLLAAKATSAALCFVVAPTAVMLPVWLSVSVQPQPIGSATLQFALLHLGIVATALTLASLVRNLAGFLLATILLFAGMMLASGLNLLPTFVPLILGIPTLHLRVMEAGVGVLVVAVLVLQFVRRRPRQGWMVLIAGLLASGSVAMRVPPRVPALDAPAPAATAADQAAVKVTPTFERFSPGSRPVLKINTPPGTEFLAPVNATRNDGGAVLQPALDWGDVAAAQVLDGTTRPETLPWALNFPWGAVPGLDFDGTLEMWRARAAIVADMPLVAGRSAASNWGTLRIVAIDRLSTGDRDVYLEEREIDSTSSWYRSQVGALAPSFYRARYFIVADGSVIRVLSVSPPQSVQINSIEVGYRQFRLGARLHLDGARLVKVLIVPESRLALPIAVHGVVDTDPRPIRSNSRRRN